jgi:quinol monooxygenase YgiN
MRLPERLPAGSGRASAPRHGVEEVVHGRQSTVETLKKETRPERVKIVGVPEIRREEMEGAVEQYVFVRLHAREGQESAVEEAMREVTGPSREEDGCLSFHTFRSMRDRRLFFIHSRWVDEAAFQRHAELPHTVRFLERVDALLDQPRDVTRTEMIV